MESKVAIPYGLRVIRVFSILSILTALAAIFALVFYSSRISTSESLLSSFGFFSIHTIILFIFSILVSILAIFTINKRDERLYKILTWLFIVQIVTSVIFSFFAAISGSMRISNLLNNLIFIAPLLFFLWYWIKMKGYFLDSAFSSEDPTVKKIDKKVNIFLIIWIVFIFVNSIIIQGIEKAATLKDSMQYWKVFQDKSIQENVDYCQSQSLKARDNCLFTAFFLEKDKANIQPEFCDLMSAREMRITCYAMIDKCQILTDEKQKSLCNLSATMYKQKQRNENTTLISTRTVSSNKSTSTSDWQTYKNTDKSNYKLFVNPGDNYQFSYDPNVLRIEGPYGYKNEDPKDYSQFNMSAIGPPNPGNSTKQCYNYDSFLSPGAYQITSSSTTIIDNQNGLKIRKKTLEGFQYNETFKVFRYDISNNTRSISLDFTCTGAEISDARRMEFSFMSKEEEDNWLINVENKVDELFYTFKFTGPGKPAGG